MGTCYSIFMKLLELIHHKKKKKICTVITNAVLGLVVREGIAKFLG